MTNNVIKMAGDQGDLARIRNAKWGYSTRRVPADLGRIHIQDIIFKQNFIL